MLYPEVLYGLTPRDLGDPSPLTAANRVTQAQLSGAFIFFTVPVSKAMILQSVTVFTSTVGVGETLSNQYVFTRDPTGAGPEIILSMTSGGGTVLVAIGNGSQFWIPGGWQLGFRKTSTPNANPSTHEVSFFGFLVPPGNIR